MPHFYTAGKRAALEKLGVNTAGVRDALLRVFQNPTTGEFATRLPLYTGTGALFGAATAEPGERLEGAGLGALGGLVGGATAAAAPALRRATIKKLQKTKV